MIESRKYDSLVQLVLYAFGFFMLWEWIRPVKELTETNNIKPFIIFMALSMVLHYFQVKIWLRYIVLLVFLGFSLHQLYYETSIYNATWLTDLFGEFASDVSLLFKARFLEISFEFQTLLVFILLWLITYLLHYWITVKKNIFLFFIVTVVVISVLDTFTEYDASFAIVRLIGIGFSAIGFLTLFRLSSQEKLTISVPSLRKWIIPLVIMVGLSSYVGLAAPKLSPQWPDPVPFITSYSEQAGGSGETNRIGYGVDDTKLGGGFRNDDTVVFRANASTSHYWKVESKDFYTGKGWVLSQEDDHYTQFANGEEFSGGTVLPPGVNKVDLQADISVDLPYTHVPYPESSSVNLIDSPTGEVYRYYFNTERITSFNEAGGALKLRRVELTYSMPRFDINEMRKMNMRDGINMGPEFMNQYTQIPTAFPDRVKQLAEEITAGKENWYDQAKAIEDYFDSGDFVYDQNDIPYPEETQDYVDQFLFETQTGYCDNFSTAMVMLLRSIDIPARWTKGYTEGTQVSYDGNTVYEVTNNNAHSWVEVFFPNVGWVPFEPTKGFTNMTNFYDGSTEAAAALTQQQQNNQTPQAATKPAPTKEEEASKENATQPESNHQSNWFTSHWKTLWIFTGAMLLVCLLIYKFRGRWLPNLLIMVYKRKADEQSFTKAYLILLRQLNRIGLKRPEGQTLREYAEHVDSYFHSGEMGKITRSYEKHIYRGDLSSGEWEQNRKLWENLIKKTIS
ncbi:transglutaminaseTgpA domain-containing protein [Bacillus sp. V5-8f]|uniref:transglutaminase TgpA family protein n=1 Tax=Bacillus sp. V5-8f TaxID=2053044 RepID=UPI000C783C2E|nr:transglutaminaseTgpA domain-containing protein [Bacillus sp. V5-8f]PLT31934.1 transglutaminase [Bacillus sp. V5-8f]